MSNEFLINNSLTRSTCRGLLSNLFCKIVNPALFWLIMFLIMCLFSFSLLLLPYLMSQLLYIGFHVSDFFMNLSSVFLFNSFKLHHPLCVFLSALCQHGLFLLILDSFHFCKNVLGILCDRRG